MKVEFFRHSLGKDEEQSLIDTLRGVFLTSGPVTREFEKVFGEYLDCRHVIGTYSCTTALFLCLKALGIGAGDEVITTPMTFIATANAILEAGAHPVFVDVERSTGNLDVQQLSGALTERTKAIIPVHLYGHMCDMRRLSDVARARGLYLIEDAAHCVEGARDGVRPGQLSDAACFSFYATKNLTAGEGGAVATNHPELAERLFILRSHGMDKAAADRYTSAYRHWDMPLLGYKANMFDLQAALLLPQIGKIADKLKERTRIRRRYDEAFSDNPLLGLPQTLDGTAHAGHLYTVWAPAGKRDAFLAGLNREGIGVAVNYRPVHLMHYYRKQFGFGPGMYPVAEEIGERTVSLPFYPGLKDEEVEAVIAAVQRTLSVL